MENKGANWLKVAFNSVVVYVEDKTLLWKYFIKTGHISIFSMHDRQNVKSYNFKQLKNINPLDALSPDFKAKLTKQGLFKYVVI